MSEVATPIVSIETTKAEISLALSKEGLAYQQLLQDCEDITFAKDTLNNERTPLINLRKVKTKLEAMVNPHTPAWKAWNEAKKSLVDPVVALLSRKEGEYKKIAAEIEEDRQKIEKENTRIDGIKNAIDTFFLEQSQAIAEAKTTPELVRVEQLIGSHKANKSRYAEFLPDLIKKSEELTPLIKKQKEAIKQLEDLKAKENEALLKGDDQAVLDHREAQEAVTQKIDENKIVAQESAIHMATSTTTEHRVIAPAAVKPRLVKWKAEIIDKKVAVSKSLELLDVTINFEKINASIKTLKDSGVFKDKTEHIVNGIRYYEDKSY